MNDPNDHHDLCNLSYPGYHSYLSSLGLTRHPFPVAPDDECFYVSERIEQIIAEIVHGICTRKGFMVLSGDVGLGKTTITRRILHILSDKSVHTSLVFHTSLKDVDLLREINRDFGILAVSAGQQSSDRFGDQLQCLNDFLMGRYRQGQNCAIIIDDAQNLDRGSLELVRMISNLETDGQKLVQILLVGQPELITALSCRELRQLRSRIIIRKTVAPLTPDELRTYVSFKLSLAGSRGRVGITHGAYRRLYSHSGGNFRVLNTLMDRCLYVLCDRDSPRIDSRCVNMAYGDLFAPPRPLRRRALAWATAALVPLMFCAAAWMIHDWISPIAGADEGVSGQYYHVPAIESPIAAHFPGLENRPVASVDREPDPARPMADTAIVKFLSHYGLERYGADLQLAIHEGSLDQLGQKMLRESGYQLVQLTSLADAVRRRYGALAISPPDDRQGWLLLWQPPLTLRYFHYQYKGEEIRQLQQMLATANVYHDRLDGIVGTHMMKAILAFQDKQKLPVTGYPDAATLFSLYNQAEES